MKFKFNLKLTICLVSLFVGFVLLIVGNQNKYCQSFGFFFLAVGIIFFAIDRTNKIDKKCIEIDKLIDKESELDDEKLIDVNAEFSTLYKQKKRINIVSYLCAILFAIVGIFVLI